MPIYTVNSLWLSTPQGRGWVTFMVNIWKLALLRRFFFFLLMKFFINQGFYLGGSIPVVSESEMIVVM